RRSSGSASTGSASTCSARPRRAGPKPASARGSTTTPSPPRSPTRLPAEFDVAHYHTRLTRGIAYNRRVSSPRLQGALALSIALALGCGDKPARGDRVSVTTDVVDRVCLGTLEHLDGEIERIEAELGLAALSEHVEIHIVGPEDIAAHCGSGRATCIKQPPRRLYIVADHYDWLLRLELARDRLARTPVGRSKPLFFEGMAAALTWPSCEPNQPSWYPPSVTDLLAAPSRHALGDDGRYRGGELIRWLLDTRGPEQVLAFVAAVPRYQDPNLVRLTYIEHFTSILDDDLFGHWRSDDEPVDRERSGCLAPELPRNEPGSTRRLAASLDCGAAEVRNDFADPSRVYIEWTLTVTEAEAGDHRVIGTLPEGVELTIESRGLIPEYWSEI